MNKTLLMLAIFMTYFLRRCKSSAPARVQKQSETLSAEQEQQQQPSQTAQQCKSGRAEDAILCEVDIRNQDTITQVKSEDETANLEPESPSSNTAQDVWGNAYKQWVGKSAGKSANERNAEKSESERRAIEVVRRQHENTDPETSPNSESAESPTTTSQNITIDLPNPEDDELNIITIAARTLASKQSTTEEITASLQLTNNLCSSGDNARQFASSKGITAILTLLQRRTRTTRMDAETTALALSTLATCSQNNHAVSEPAVREGVIENTVLAAEQGGDAIRAAALRVLLVLTDTRGATDALWTARAPVIRLVTEGLRDVLHAHGKERRRGVIRAFALVEACLRKDGDRWPGPVDEARVYNAAKMALQSTDVDIRECAARVVSLLRRDKER